MTQARQLSFIADDDSRKRLAQLREHLSRLGEGGAYEIDVMEPPEHLFAVGSSTDVADRLGPQMQDLPQEQLRVLLLDSKNRVTRVFLAYQGTVDSLTLRPADVYRPAVRHNAASVIVVHNHPSGTSDASPEDITATKLLAQAGDLMGIRLLDHIIIGRGSHRSLAQECGLSRG